MSTEQGSSRTSTLGIGIVLGVMVIVGLVVFFDDAPVEEEEGPRDFRTSAPAVEETEDLEDTIVRLLERVVNEPDVEALELSDELADALDREDLGDLDRRDEAAAETVREMMDAASEFQGEHGGSDEMRRRALRQQATTLVRQLYEATEHEEPETPTTFGERPEGYRRLVWEELTDIDYEEGDPLPSEVTSLNGERVAMAGFLVEAGFDDLLLVRSVWSCCFGQPPALHEAVVVRVPGEVEDAWFDGIVRVVGTLEVGEERDLDGYVSSIYRIRPLQVDVLE